MRAYSKGTVPHANNKGVRIHYEIEGHGAPLVLLHGLSEDLGWWHDFGYVASLRDSYQLILVDVRGHGSSDKPHSPDEYRLELLVEDIVSVLDGIGISKAHLLGFSMGAWIGFGVGRHASQRFHSLILGSMSPYAKPNEPRNFVDLFKKGKNFTWDFFEKASGQWMTPQMKARWMTNDLEALIELVSKDWMFSVEDVLPTITMPCLLFAGEADRYYDGVRKGAGEIPNSTFVSFPNLGHIETLYRSDLVIPCVRQFLATVSPT